MKYPQYLSIGNWLFIHLKKDEFEYAAVGGPIPENLYYAYHYFKALDLSKDLRTYEGLIANGATEPDDKTFKVITIALLFLVAAGIVALPEKITLMIKS